MIQPLTALRRLAATGVALAAPGLAFAQVQPPEGLELVGVPYNGGTGFQPAATDIARRVYWLDDFLLIIIAAITLFVTALIAYVILRYNRRANPTPASFTHNSPLEVAWTVVPIVILVVIGAYSLPVLFYQQEIPEADVTIKVTGFQWFWGYEYIDEGISFESYMLRREELPEYGYDDSLYQLATDTAVVVPMGANVTMQVTAADVIHSWTIPAFGVKQDGVPSRVAELWFNAEREGIYFGQCSELCGKDHAFMPITVWVVSPEAYAAWVAEQGGTPTAYIEGLGGETIETAAVTN